MKNIEFKSLSFEETTAVKGGGIIGKAGWLGAIYEVAKDGFHHSDQIMSGFKYAWNKY